MACMTWMEAGHRGTDLMLWSSNYCVCVCVSHSVVSDSLWPHGRQPSRLPRPWDSPGKNTGVGCHCLLLVLLHACKTQLKVDPEPSHPHTPGFLPHSPHRALRTPSSTVPHPRCLQGGAGAPAALTLDLTQCLAPSGHSGNSAKWVTHRSSHFE